MPNPKAFNQDYARDLTGTPQTVQQALDALYTAADDIPGLESAVAALEATIATLGTAAFLDEATSAQWRNNTADKVLSTDQTWGAMAEVSLTDAATIAVDLSTGFDFTVTLGGNRTLGNPTNVKVGQRGRIRIVQDGTGSRTLGYGSNWEFVNATAPVLSTAAAAQDILYYDCISSTRIFATLQKAIG